LFPNTSRLLLGSSFSFHTVETIKIPTGYALSGCLPDMIPVIDVYELSRYIDIVEKVDKALMNELIKACLILAFF